MPICVKRDKIMDNDIDFYFNIKPYHVEAINKAKDKDMYYSIIVSDEVKEFMDIDGFKHNYHSSKLNVIRNEKIINKLKELSTPRIEEYLFDF